MSMHWQGKDLVTIGELAKAVVSIETREDAQKFMRQYRETTEHADQNIGYLSGYYDRETMARIQDWFGAAHPIFGRAMLKPEQTIAAGRALASGANPDDIRAMLDPA